MKKGRNHKEHRERVIQWLLRNKAMWQDLGFPLRDECRRKLKAALFSPKTALCDINLDRYIQDPRCQKWMRL